MTTICMKKNLIAVFFLISIACKVFEIVKTIFKLLTFLLKLSKVESKEVDNDQRCFIMML